MQQHYCGNLKTLETSQQLFDACVMHRNSECKMVFNNVKYRSAFEYVYDTLEYEGITDKFDLLTLKDILSFDNTSTAFASLIESYEIDIKPIIADINRSMGR